MRVFIVVPAYNERGAIGAVVASLRARYPDVVVVDDGSDDDTGAVARGAGAVVLRHVINRGQGAALQSGIAYGLRRGADVIVTFDADGQHRVEDLPALIEPVAAQRADVALGSRFLEHRDAVPRGRRLLLAGAVAFTRVTARMKVTDAHNGLRAFSRRAAEALDIRLDRMAHASEILDLVRRSGLRYTEVPVRVRYTEYSVAKGQRAGSAVRVAFDYLFDKLLS